ncbi:hypothetical protein [Deferribacter abyssi]|uniref:hypothetical protein n=1 Tax=Deferribacter abyssi TaxID=213806 RepID=UPI003C2648DB
MLRRFFIFLFLLVPLVSFARFEKLVGEIDDLLAPVKGYVVAVEGDTVYTDISNKYHVVKGKKLKIYREGSKIIHPITGEVLGVKRAYIASIVLTDVFEKYSVGKIVDSKNSIKNGDLVIADTPVTLKVMFNNFDRRLELLLREDLAKASNFVVSDNGEYNLKFFQDDKGGITYELMLNDTLITKKYYADINKTFLVSDKSRLQTVDLLMSNLIKKEYRVMSVGDVYGDKYDYIVVATDDSVDVYKFDGKQFVYVDKIKGDFSEIISIETIDLNQNGKDEIFISNLTKTGSLKSMIYEYSGKRFKLLKKSIPFIFRTVSINGEKRLVCQRVSRDGLFLGNIYFYVYNNYYVKGDRIDGTDKIGIYGFGYADIDNDKFNEVLYVNDDYNLEVYKNGKKVYESTEYFNETPYYFLLKKEIDEASNIMENKMTFDEAISYKKYFKGRLFFDKDGKLYVLKNNPVARFLPNFKVYTDSSIASYKWENNRLRKLWESDVFKPVIVDYYVKHKYGKDYVILLRNESGELFAKTRSQFIYMEIK